MKLNKVNADKALYCINTYWDCIKTRKNDQVQKDVKKRVNHLTSELDQK